MDGPSDESENNEVPSHSRCGMIKIPLCSKALSAELRPAFCSPLQGNGDVSFKVKKNLEQDIKQYTLNKSIYQENKNPIYIFFYLFPSFKYTLSNFKV
jgi:hypothetical protein